MLSNHPGTCDFPVAERRRERLLKDEDPSDLVDTSDDDAAWLHPGAEGSSTKRKVRTNPTSPAVEAELE